jgi:HrpA-like RNA helicase
VNLPVDVPIGKMLIVACVFGQVEAMLTMAAGLSVQSIFTQRSYRDPDCQTARQALISDHGDVFTLINTYREWIRVSLGFCVHLLISSTRKCAQVRVEGQEYTRRWCRQRGIEEQRLYDISKLRQQFADLLIDADLTQLNLLASHKNDAKNATER